MTTTLQIWTANKGTLLTSISNATAGGILGGYKWQRGPNGNNIQLEFSGRNDRVRVPPRGVVQLFVDGGEAFFGVLPDPPPLSSTEAVTMQVLGGQEALRVTLLDSTAYLDQGVYDIVRDILQRLIPPCLLYSGAGIGNGTGTDAGPTLSTYYAPTKNLKDALDDLAKSAATSWGVDSGGRVFFGQTAPAALVIPYAGNGWRELQVQGREAVTRAVLRIVSAPVLPDGGSAVWTYGLPDTVTSVAQSADHALYRAEHAYSAPEGVALIEPVATGSAAPSSDFAVAAVLDNDPATHVQVDLSNPPKNLIVRSVASRVVGVEFDYVLPPTEDMPANAYGWALRYDGAQATGTLPTTNESRTVRVILPPDTRGARIWVASFSIGAVLAIIPTPTPLLTVSRVRFLVIDEDAAARVAASYLQPPFAQPAEITLKMLESPRSDVTVTGTPGGDVSGPSTLWEYVHDDLDVRTTKIRIGATGADPTVRALKFAVGQP